MLSLGMRAAGLILAALGGGLLVWTAGTAEAAIVHRFNVQIDDRTDTLSATIDGAAVTLLPDSTGEFIHFLAPYPAGFTAGAGASFSQDLLEPDALTLSDRLLFTIGVNALDVQFGSDPATVAQGNHASPVVETGTSQVLLSGPFETIFSGTDSVVFDFFGASDRGDVREVPEPAPLLLLSVALVGLAGITWRRHRRK